MPSKKVADSPELAAYKEEAEHSVNVWLAPLTLLMKAKRIERIRMGYTGSEDSGQIDQIEFFVKGKAEPVSFDEAGFTKDTEDKIERLLYDILEVRGWEMNNEGSHGVMVRDVRQDMFTHEHKYHKYTDCEIDHDHDHDADDAGCETGVEDDGGYDNAGCDDLRGRIESEYVTS